MSALLKLVISASAVLATRSSKRGLIYIPNANTPQDDSIWFQSGTDLTWYYTYNDTPNPAYSNVNFVPMMWGMGSNPNETSFLDKVDQLIDQGVHITHALSFNEPDQPNKYGGSGLTPSYAAQGYVANFVPLRQRGIKIGMPAVSGASWGIEWLHEFVSNCTQILKAKGSGSCPYDFLPVHWYDNFGGFQAHIQEAMTAFPNTKIWVTEFAYAHQNLVPTQQFYNQSTQYLDSTAAIERYSYFGSFRSNVSNVGANATFLNNAGRLTDIGSWYLGFNATGVNPQSG